MLNIKNIISLAFASFSLITISYSHAESSYPDRPIKFVVGFPPGGTTDLVARIVAVKMGEELKQSVIVENKPGAGGNIASNFVAKAPADGYTIYLGTLATHSINPAIQKLSFDPVNDFTMIGQIGFYTNLVLVGPRTPAKNLAEFIAYAKQQPRPLTFGSPGNGTSGHLTGEFFKKAAGIDLVHVPYKGSGQALTDLLGGQIDVMFDNLPSALPLVESGKLRALAVTAENPVPQLPQVPTAVASGIKDMVVDVWVGLMAPHGVPQEIIEKLNKTIQNVAGDASTREKLLNRGISIRTSTPAEFSNYVKNEKIKWEEIVKNAHIDVN
ncbi:MULTISPECIES: Bug family tripartite tricarboxylate transporter substrate binding protein [Pseudomonadota]